MRAPICKFTYHPLKFNSPMLLSNTYKPDLGPHLSGRPLRMGAFRSPVLHKWLLLLSLSGALLTGCAVPPPTSARPMVVQLPLFQGWYEGEQVFYVTTDASDAQVAKDKNANFAPRLADALPPSQRQPGQRSAVDKVYVFTNVTQAIVFASAPEPMGYQSRSSAYSPLWRMTKVIWKAATAASTLRSEEEVLDAAEKGLLVLEETPVIINCPIVHLGDRGGLPGAVIAAPR